MCSITWPTLGDIANWITIVTPGILLTWFYYSQRLQLSKSYFSGIEGDYGGYVGHYKEHSDNEHCSGGMLFSIKEIDDQGNFIGELSFTAFVTNSTTKKITTRTASHNNFIGRFDFSIKLRKKRNALNGKENRKYKGVLNIVDRLDTLIEQYDMTKYLIAEYDIEHFREMKYMKFTLRKTHKTHYLPKVFFLYKKKGIFYEPHEAVKKTFFEKNDLWKES